MRSREASSCPLLTPQSVWNRPREKLWGLHTVVVTTEIGPAVSVQWPYSYFWLDCSRNLKSLTHSFKIHSRQKTKALAPPLNFVRNYFPFHRTFGQLEYIPSEWWPSEQKTRTSSVRNYLNSSTIKPLNACDVSLVQNLWRTMMAGCTPGLFYATTWYTSFYVILSAGFKRLFHIFLLYLFLRVPMFS